MPHSYLVLYDFSSYARQALRVAHQWSLWTGADVHLLHNLEAAYIPAMADREVRQQVEAGSRSEAFDKLQRSYEEVTGKPVRPERVHISVASLTFTINKLVREHNTQLLFAGLKGNGVLKRIFIGSTILKLLEHAITPVVAIPKKIHEFKHLTLHVAVSYHYAFNSTHLRQILQLMGQKIKALVFISVLTKDDDRQRAISHLAKLEDSFSEQAPVSSRLFEGNAPFALVKAYMKEQEDGVLLAQRGSRALSDRLFREFFINELVHDASIPIIILPE
ncbi:universal stress protein [Pontibacter diazotrophicus]|uniref:Universal stress protein n=1 Tax=Pontibacter diazotrophicus TaxID=1400979 RepID=A0A3D8L840_9BACT|nr:universal stress protein [Pontibacter diazotrophicus]RDV13579.1 universal stress protein [Pontibacter diazotrophicus]